MSRIADVAPTSARARRTCASTAPVRHRARLLAAIRAWAAMLQAKVAIPAAVVHRLVARTPPRAATSRPVVPLRTRAAIRTAVAILRRVEPLRTKAEPRRAERIRATVGRPAADRAI